MRLLGAAAIAGCLAVVPAQAEDEWSEAEAFVASNIIHIMLHEAGHAVIDQFGLPVIGQEEDAADSFATFEVLNLYEDHVDILLDSAEAMLIMHDLAEAGGEPFDYFDIHDLDIQRGLRIVCHAVGLDPERYAEAARCGPVAGLCRSFDHVSCRKGEHRWHFDQPKNSVQKQYA